MHNAGNGSGHHPREPTRRGESRASSSPSIGFEIVSPSRIESAYLADRAVRTSKLPHVSRVMFKCFENRDSGSYQRVPSVRVERAIEFFSISMPKTGQFSENISHPMRPALNLRINFIKQPHRQREQWNHVPVDSPLHSKPQLATASLAGNSVPKSVKDCL